MKKDINEELKKCQEERDEYLAGWQRQKADFANYQKDVSDQIKRSRDLANENLIFKLLSVLDSFDLSILAFKKEDLSEKEKNILKGVELIKSQLESILKGEGLESIESLNKEFDPEIHEAVENSSSESDDNLTVEEEIQKGYKLNGKVIRPSKVKTK